MSRKRLRLVAATVVLVAFVSGLGTKRSPLATAAAATATTGCSVAGTGTTIMRTLGPRSYALHVPSNLTGTAVPLLVDLHGDYEPVSYEEQLSGWSAYADSHNFIVAYPVGIGSWASWDYGAGSPDVAFLRSVVSDISSTWCIDARHVHVAGISNGGMMTARLACDAADVFASVDIHAGVEPTLPSPTQWSGSGCTPSRPIAVAITFGMLDPASSYPLNLDARSQWLARDGCPTTGTTEPNVTVEAITYGPCNGGVELLWRVYPQTHNWPINQPLSADMDDLHNRVWQMFMRNPLP